MKKKLLLSDLEVKSFVTSMETNKEATIKGGQLITNTNMCTSEPSLATCVCTDPEFCGGTGTGCPTNGCNTGTTGTLTGDSDFFSDCCP